MCYSAGDVAWGEAENDSSTMVGSGYSFGSSAGRAGLPTGVAEGAKRASNFTSNTPSLSTTHDD